MPIREKRYECGEYLEVSICPISKVEQKKSRAKKRKESRKEQKNLNAKNSKRNLRRRLHENFTTNDYIGHFTFSDSNLPQTEEEAIKEKNNLMRRIRNYRKKHGLEDLKYIAVLEYRDEDKKDGRTKKRVHFHIVLSGGMDRNILEDLWGRGRAEVRRLQPDENGFEGLANYISKDPKGKKRWSQSRNIIIPEPQINDYKISRKKYVDLIRNGDRAEYEKMYPGYIYTKQRIYHNPEDGLTYIYIKMRRRLDYEEGHRHKRVSYR